MLDKPRTEKPAGLFLDDQQLLDDQQHRISKSAIVGAAVGNGHEIQLVPEAELRRVERLDEGEEPSSESNDDGWTAILPQQAETELSYNDKGDLLIRQHDWPGNEHLIIVSKDSIDAFIDRLTDFLGIPSFP